jgi:phosphatidate cytidylyltransferase
VLTRLLTALVLGGVVVSLIAFGPADAVAAMLIVVIGVCYWEFHSMASPGFMLDRVVGSLCVTTFLAASYWGTPFSVAASAALLIFLPALTVVARIEPVEEAGRRLTASWGGAVYLAGTAYFGLYLVGNSDWMFTMCIVIWGADSGAYFAGRAFGKHKLHPQVSPNKTIEGAVGGLLTSLIGAAVISETLMLDSGIGLGPCLIAAAIGGVLGPIGDLVESAFKRAYNVKDSGTLLPGHGGFLDRLDALLLAMPFFALYGAYLGVISL